MPIKINNPTIIEAAGNRPKKIEEYIGHVNSKTSDLSIARMVSPAGWVEPGQRPEFTEYTVVLKGILRVQRDLGSDQDNILIINYNLDKSILDMVQ